MAGSSTPDGLRTSNRKCSAANSGAVNRRSDEAVAAGIKKSSATWKVGNVRERAKVRRCTAAEDLVHQGGNLGPDVFRLSHIFIRYICYASSLILVTIIVLATTHY